MTTSTMSMTVAGRIRADYVEMPGLRVTSEQAIRLWGFGADEVEQAFSTLVSEGFLMRDPRGAYRRSPCPRCS